MPRRLENVKDFLICARRKDTRWVTIKKSKTGGPTKFKCRTKKYLYTLSIPEGERANKLQETLPPAIKINKI